MPPNDSNPPVEPILPVSPDVAAPPPPVDPVTTPGPTIAMQPADTIASAPPLATSPTPPPPPPMPPSASVSSNGTGVSPATYVPKKRFPVKILLIIVALLALLGIGAFALTQLLPNGALNQSAELTWWGLWEDETVVAPLISEYIQQHPNVKINYVKQSSEDYRERLTSALAQGNGPDIFRFHNSWVPMFKSAMDFMPESVMTPSEYAQTFYPVVTSDLSLGTSFAGIPLGFDALVLYINQDIFDTYLKTPPATWDELRQLAKDLTIKDETGAIQQSGVAIGRVENVDHWPEILGLLMLQNNVDMKNPTGQLAEDALDFFTRIAKTDGVWNETLPPSTAAFAGGKLAMYFGPSWRAHDIRQLSPELNFKAVPVPQLPKEREGEASVYYASYWAEGVSKESKGKAAAWDFLKFMSQSESLQKLYQAQSQVDPARKFGEPYPRVDMANLVSSDPVVGAVVAQGREAKGWYMVSRTFDGPTGINSQIDKYYENAINSIHSGTDPKNALNAVAAGVSQVLAQYGLIAPLPTPSE